MFNPSLMQRVQHRIEIKTRPWKAPFRRKQLNNTDFTIISNNCWGGMTYEMFGLQKLSPTVGCYFFADDYIRFVRNLRLYLSVGLEFVPVEEAKHREQIIKNGNGKCPIGRLCVRGGNMQSVATCFLRWRLCLCIIKRKNLQRTNGTEESKG